MVNRLMRGISHLLVDLSAYCKTRFGCNKLENLLIGWASRLHNKRLSSTQRTVAIFGASFNPTTLGHIDLIRRLLCRLPQDIQKIAVIPAAQSPLKAEGAYAAKKDRLAILNLMLQTQLTPDERKNIEVLSLEVDRYSPSWMVMTLTALIIEHRGMETYRLICGYDHILFMQQWYRWQDLAHLCELYFYPRAEIDIVTMPCIQACIALSRAGIKITLIFVKELQKTQFFDLLQAQLSEQDALSIHLIWDPGAEIRACSATAIRQAYQTKGAFLPDPPVGMSPEAHQYILEHHCYQKLI